MAFDLAPGKGEQNLMTDEENKKSGRKKGPHVRKQESGSQEKGFLMRFVYSLNNLPGPCPDEPMKCLHGPSGCIICTWKAYPRLFHQGRPFSSQTWEFIVLELLLGPLLGHHGNSCSCCSGPGFPGGSLVMIMYHPHAAKNKARWNSCLS